VTHQYDLLFGALQLTNVGKLNQASEKFKGDDRRRVQGKVGGRGSGKARWGWRGTA
jgi:hypothetical protein